jgi:uncharacterized phosphosugar-binding protein
MSELTEQYFGLVHEYLDRLDAESGPTVKQIARMFADCFQANGIVQLVGIKHGCEFAMELGYRAGGLMPFHQCNIKHLLNQKKRTEQQIGDPKVYDDPQIARDMLALYNIDPHDLFLIVSASGCEAVAVECAQIARDHGHQVIAVVNRREAEASVSTHPSGKKLTDLADVVLDTLAPYPDVEIEVAPGVRMAQINTLCGNILAQMITAETYRYMTEQGMDCPVLLSANVQGADVHNKAISDPYEGRWR